MAGNSGPDDARPTPWWQTLPGILTAVGSLLTAAGGLLLALHQVGLLDRGRAAPVATAPAGRGAQAHSAAPTPPPETVSGVSFPAGAKVTLGNNRGRGTYELLDAQFHGRTADAGTLTLHIRLTNAGPADIGFWSDSFRLLVDGVPRAPTTRLNDLVEARSAKEAEVLFAVPLPARNLSLSISSGEEDGAIPLTLRGSR